MPYTPSASDPASGTLSSYLRAIRRHGWLVACVALAALVASAAWAGTRSRQYQATAQILITPVESGDPAMSGLPILHDTSDPAVVVETASALIYSTAAADLSATKLGPPWTSKRLMSAVSVEPHGGSNLLDVIATAGSPSTAVRVANTFAQSSLEARRIALQRQVAASISALRQRLADAKRGSAEAHSLGSRLSTLTSELGVPDPTLSLAEAASDGVASGPSASSVIPLAVLAGIVVGCLAAVLLELVATTVRDEADLVDTYPLPILARVPLVRRRSPRGARRATLLDLAAFLRGRGEPAKPRPARAGAGRELSAELARPSDGPGVIARVSTGNGDHGWSMPPAVGEAFRGLLLQLEDPRGGSQVLMITSPGTGDGKTTAALNLAATAAAAGRSVSLLDLDLYHANIAARLGLSRRSGPAELGDDGIDLQELMQPAPGLPALQVLATRALDIAQVRQLGLLEQAVRGLPALIRRAAETAEIVIVDAPALGEVSDALRMLPAVDDVVLAVRIGHTQRSTLANVRDLLRRSDRLPAGFVLFGTESVVEPRYEANGRRTSEPAGRPPERVLER